MSADAGDQVAADRDRGDHNRERRCGQLRGDGGALGRGGARVLAVRRHAHAAEPARSRRGGRPSHRRRAPVRAGGARSPAPGDAPRQRDRRLGDRGRELLAGGRGDRDHAERRRAAPFARASPGGGRRHRHAAAARPVPRPARRRRSVDPRLAAAVAGRRARRRPSSPASRSSSTRRPDPASARRWTTSDATSPSERDRGRRHRAGAAALRDAGSGRDRLAPLRRRRRRRGVSAGGRWRSGRGPDPRRSSRRTAGRARLRVRSPGPRGVRLTAGASRSTCARRSRRTSGSGRAPSSASRSRAAVAELAGVLGRTRRSWRTRAGGERDRAWVPGRSRPRASWSRPACATKARSARWSPATRCRSAGDACSRCPSGPRGCPGMLRRGFSVCCTRSGPPSSRACRGWC